MTQQLKQAMDSPLRIKRITEFSSGRYFKVRFENFMVSLFTFYFMFFVILFVNKIANFPFKKGESRNFQLHYSYEITRENKSNRSAKSPLMITSVRGELSDWLQQMRYVALIAHLKLPLLVILTGCHFDLFLQLSFISQQDGIHIQ